jgi:hypothetical protein
MSTVNSGIVLRVLPRTVFTFTGLGASPAAATVPVAQHIDVTPFTEAELQIRFHAGSTGLSAGQTVSVSVLPEGYTFDDPTAVFTGTPATFTTPAGGPAALPFYTLLPVPTGFGRLLSVSVVANGGNVAGANYQFALSLDLLLKGGDPGAIAMMPNGFRGYRIM